jgi:hypothetical protein
MIPFTTAQFFAVFSAYNETIWPAQLAAVSLGAVALLAIARPNARTDQIVLAILGVIWAWTGGLYFIAHFARINPVATLFGAGFVLQAGFLALGVSIRPRPPEWR